MLDHNSSRSLPMADQPTQQPGLDLRWTISNALSALRIVLVIPAVLAINADMRMLAIGLFVLAAVTDMLDGYLARRLHEISDLGKILDPLADKIFVGAIVVQLLLRHELPLWFVAVVLGRDLLILLGGIYIERRTGVVLPSNYPGKIAVLTLSLTLLLVVAGIGPTPLNVMIAINLLLLAVSIVLYAKRAVEQGGKKV
jgi:CDP-diacylglycerol--glycerol-3-phosphate 3-phosphatidyltransferase